MKNRSAIIGASLILIGFAGMLITHIIFSSIYDGGKQGRRFRSTEKSNSVEEGRRIYRYGVNGRGEVIPYDAEDGRGMHGRRRYQMMYGNRQNQMMHVGGLGCVECHRRDGKGGRRLNGDTSADIRWKELEKENFDFEKFKRAVTEGSENGETLSEFMPRYDMTDSELNSLIKYLKTLK